MAEPLFEIKNAKIYDYNRHGMIAFTAAPWEMPKPEHIKALADTLKADGTHLVIRVYLEETHESE